ncbi:MAG: glycosyltransferase family 4 protein [Phormidesmis sp.]
MFVNLAYLLKRPTGTTSYALNLLPYIEALSPVYLATPASGLAERLPDGLASAPSNRANYRSVPTNMTAENGTAGHLRRLLWTQFQLPKLITPKRTSQSSLLFTPIPEAPLSFFESRPSFRSIVTFHDLIPLRFPHEFGAIKHYYRYYVPQVLAQAKKVICNSEATARDVTDFYGIPAHKLVPIPLAYDAKHFRPVSARPNFPQALSLTNTPYFLTLGRQAPYKNIGAVITALAQVPDCQLVIAGPIDPRYTPELEKLAVEKGVRSRVKFLSYVPYSQLPALLSHAIALVFPSLWEGFGLPVLEAMACGTPVIASKVASLPEVTGDAAYLIDPGNMQTMVGAMSAIATDNTTQQQLRKAGLQRVRAFSWEKTGQATVEVLQPFV